MALNSIYTGALMEHNSYPSSKYEIENPTHSHRGVNPTCGDDITLSLVVENGTIEEAAFTGSGCAISQASADIMAELVMDKPLEEAVALSESFVRMIRGEELTAEEAEALGEAVELKDISYMPARVKCAELAWRTLEQLLEAKEGAPTQAATTEAPGDTRPENVE